MYEVVFHNSVGIPQSVPLSLPKLIPEGKVALISHEVMSPGPVKVGASGRSLLTVLFVRFKFSGE